MNIEDVNSTLKKYLFEKFDNLDSTKLDFSFELPNKSWVDGSEYKKSENWINIYLLEVKDNLEQRRSQWERNYENGKVKDKKPPFYVDLYYILTFYNTKSNKNIEHNYLGSTLLALYDFSDLSKSILVDSNLVNLLKEMKLELFPKPYSDEQLGFQLWSALDQDARPMIPLKITIPLESEVLQSNVPVKTKEIIYLHDEVLYTLTGRVLVEDVGEKTPAGFAIVEIKKKGGTVIYTTETDVLGKFEFKQLKNEELAVIAKVEGYVAKEIDLDDFETIIKPVTIIVNEKQP